MIKKYLSVLLPAISALLLPGAAAAQDAHALSAQDYIDIRHLIDTYPRILDMCINGGEDDYANLFTEDATFGVSSQWGSGVKIWFRGREQLKAIGSGACRNGPGNTFHLNINPSIVPTADGAYATSTLLTIVNDTDRRGDVVHWEGGYEDTFEKTAAGWRFKSRVHVWPEVAWTDNPADMPPRNLEEE